MKKLKLLSLALALLMVLFAIVSCDGNNSGSEETEPVDTHIAPSLNSINFNSVDYSNVEIVDEVTDLVVISVENYGDIVIRLYPEVAPKTVANFKKLVSEKFYDGLIFHRVIKDFMIQGGDPKGNGTGGSSETIKGEFASNGFENNLMHKRGVVSMARGNDNNSASSQFFIVHKTSSHLDGNYAAFGYVVSGMSVVDKIAIVSTDYNDKPEYTVRMKSVRFAKISDTPVNTEPTPTAPTMDQLDMSEITDISAMTESTTPTDTVVIDVKDYGKIVVRLYPDVAPETVANFKKLVSEGFYDGLIFHRVIKDFMIQGGDPLGTGYGGSDETIKGEFLANGFVNNLSHKRGVISMARKGSGYNTASSQFFIVHADQSDLDGQYATFGYVVYGMDVVDAIANTEVAGPNSKPVNDIVINSIKFVTI